MDRNRKPSLKPSAVLKIHSPFPVSIDSKLETIKVESGNEAAPSNTYVRRAGNNENKSAGNFRDVSPKSRLKTFRSRMFQRDPVKPLPSKKQPEANKKRTDANKKQSEPEPKKANVNKEGRKPLAPSDRTSRQPAAPQTRPCNRFQRYNLRGKSKSALRTQSKQPRPSSKVAERSKIERQTKSGKISTNPSPSARNNSRTGRIRDRAPQTRSGRTLSGQDSTDGECDDEVRPQDKSLPFGYVALERMDGSMFQDNSSHSSSTDCSGYSVTKRRDKADIPPKTIPAVSKAIDKGVVLSKSIEDTTEWPPKEQCTTERRVTLPDPRRYMEKPESESDESASSQYVPDTDGYATEVKEEFKKMKEEAHTWSTDSWLDSFPEFEFAEDIAIDERYKKPCKTKRRRPEGYAPSKPKEPDSSEDISQVLTERHASERRKALELCRALGERQELERQLTFTQKALADIETSTGTESDFGDRQTSKKRLRVRKEADSQLPTSEEEFPSPRPKSAHRKSSRGNLQGEKKNVVCEKQEQSKPESGIRPSLKNYPTSDEGYDADYEDVMSEMHTLPEVAEVASKQRVVLSEILEQLHETQEVLDEFEQSLKSTSAVASPERQKETNVRQIMDLAENKDSAGGRPPVQGKIKIAHASCPTVDQSRTHDQFLLQVALETAESPSEKIIVSPREKQQESSSEIPPILQQVRKPKPSVSETRAKLSDVKTPSVQDELIDALNHKFSQNAETSPERQNVEIAEAPREDKTSDEKSIPLREQCAQPAPSCCVPSTPYPLAANFGNEIIIADKETIIQKIRRMYGSSLRAAETKDDQQPPENYIIKTIKEGILQPILTSRTHHRPGTEKLIIDDHETAPRNESCGNDSNILKAFERNARLTQGINSAFNDSGLLQDTSRVSSTWATKGSSGMQTTHLSSASDTNRQREIECRANPPKEMHSSPRIASLPSDVSKVSSTKVTRAPTTGQIPFQGIDQNFAASTPQTERTAQNPGGHPTLSRTELFPKDSRVPSMKITQGSTIGHGQVKFRGIDQNLVASTPERKRRTPNPEDITTLSRADVSRISSTGGMQGSPTGQISFEGLDQSYSPCAPQTDRRARLPGEQPPLSKAEPSSESTRGSSSWFDHQDLSWPTRNSSWQSRRGNGKSLVVSKSEMERRAHHPEEQHDSSGAGCPLESSNVSTKTTRGSTIGQISFQGLDQSHGAPMAGNRRSNGAAQGSIEAQTCEQGPPPPIDVDTQFTDDFQPPNISRAETSLPMQQNLTQQEESECPEPESQGVMTQPSGFISEMKSNVEAKRQRKYMKIQKCKDACEAASYSSGSDSESIGMPVKHHAEDLTQTEAPRTSFKGQSPEARSSGKEKCRRASSGASPKSSGNNSKNNGSSRDRKNLRKDESKLTTKIECNTSKNSLLLKSACSLPGHASTTEARHVTTQQNPDLTRRHSLQPQTRVSTGRSRKEYHSDVVSRTNEDMRTKVLPSPLVHESTGRQSFPRSSHSFPRQNPTPLISEPIIGYPIKTENDPLETVGQGFRTTAESSIYHQGRPISKGAASQSLSSNAVIRNKQDKRLNQTCPNYSTRQGNPSSPNLERSADRGMHNSNQPYHNGQAQMVSQAQPRSQTRLDYVESSRRASLPTHFPSRHEHDNHFQPLPTHEGSARAGTFRRHSLNLNTGQRVDSNVRPTSHYDVPVRNSRLQTYSNHNRRGTNGSNHNRRGADDAQSHNRPTNGLSGRKGGAFYVYPDTCRIIGQSNHRNLWPTYDTRTGVTKIPLSSSNLHDIANEDEHYHTQPIYDTADSENSIPEDLPIFNRSIDQDGQFQPWHVPGIYETRDNIPPRCSYIRQQSAREGSPQYLPSHRDTDEEGYVRPRQISDDDDGYVQLQPVYDDEGYLQPRRINDAGGYIQSRPITDDKGYQCIDGRAAREPGDPSPRRQFTALQSSAQDHTYESISDHPYDVISDDSLEPGPTTARKPEDRSLRRKFTALQSSAQDHTYESISDHAHDAISADSLEYGPTTVRKPEDRSLRRQFTALQSPAQDHTYESISDHAHDAISDDGQKNGFAPMTDMKCSLDQSYVSEYTQSTPSIHEQDVSAIRQGILQEIAKRPRMPTPETPNYPQDLTADSETCRGPGESTPVPSRRQGLSMFEQLSVSSIRRDVEDEQDGEDSASIAQTQPHSPPERDVVAESRLAYPPPKNSALEGSRSKSSACNYAFYEIDVLPDSEPRVRQMTGTAQPRVSPSDHAQMDKNGYAHGYAQDASESEQLPPTNTDVIVADYNAPLKLDGCYCVIEEKPNQKPTKLEECSRNCLARKVQTSVREQLLDELEKDPHFLAMSYHLIGAKFLKNPLSKLTEKDKEELVDELIKEFAEAEGSIVNPLRQLQDELCENEMSRKEP